MNKKLRDIVDVLGRKWQALLTIAPVIADDVPSDTPAGGVYLFSENGAHLYAVSTEGLGVAQMGNPGQNLTFSMGNDTMWRALHVELPTQSRSRRHQ